MSNLRILCRDYPERAIALATSEYALVFQHGSPDQVAGPRSGGKDAPRCLVEFASISHLEADDYRVLGYGHGTLGLITLDEEVFLCVVTRCSRAATVRPGETVSRIDNVDFYCLTHSGYEGVLDYGSEIQYPADDFNRAIGLESRELTTDHPFMALKKLLSDGSFYYSLDFNLTDSLQNRFDKPRIFDIEALDEDMLWNSYMISPLLHFRSRLPTAEKLKLDSSQILTCVIRGFSGSMRIPAFSSAQSQWRTDLPALLTIISRQSSRRAGTRFNSRGIDDQGNVANFVETEMVLWIPPGTTFSYVQIRGSLPIFWEQAPGLIPGQQRIEVTRSTEATQHAFNKHFDLLGLKYGTVHVVNLLGEDKPGESELSAKFRGHIAKSPLRQQTTSHTGSESSRLQLTHYDFHAESRGPMGFGASTQLKQELSDPIQGYEYFLGDLPSENLLESEDAPQNAPPAILQQQGVFRTNCLDCLDRTNLVQTIISSAVLESFLHQQGGRMISEFDRRHSTLWADNGDALSKIYAGTGAIKSSFTRHGKMSLAGALADARKSATRLYINNFSDNVRQNTIDLLLGRLTNQMPVHLYDPVNDLVSEELKRRASEYTSSKRIRIWTGTFNVNGRNQGLDVDITPWLFPSHDKQSESPTVFAVAFQEIVPLNPQQIMSTDPTTRKAWENTVSSCLRNHARLKGTQKYVLLRSTQLVGAALIVYVREDALHEIKNVEASTKKTGLQGVSGNKGGCAIRFEYSNTQICFVSGHFAAGTTNYNERNRDYDTIHHGLTFQRNRSIEDHDTILWLGDFNYRISLDNEHARELAREGRYQELYEMDQLNHQMSAGLAFPFHREGPITFPPTYKYDLGTDDYDTSEKARIPAWCDRVLWKGANLRQTQYNAADLRISDHRPVWATFDCMISVVNEVQKNKLARLLYGEKQHGIGDRATNTLLEHITGEEQQTLIPPDLPPPSSDHRKWWLDNDKPEKSTLLPANGLFPNPHRKSNPFLLDMEIDWSPAPAPSPAKARTQGSTAPKGTTTRNVPLPPNPRSEGSNVSARQTTTRHHSPNPNPSPGSGSGSGFSKPETKPSKDTPGKTVAPHKTDDSSPPPIPRKPATLRPGDIPRPRPSGSGQRGGGGIGTSGGVAPRGHGNADGGGGSVGEGGGGGGSDLLGGGMNEEVSWKPLMQ